jgi:uridylate kinase
VYKRIKRILLKLSGEVLSGARGYGFDPDAVSLMAKGVRDACDSGAQVGVVIGGGNIFRGADASSIVSDRVSADTMGMLATIINALALKEALNKTGIDARVLTAIEMPKVAETMTKTVALEHLNAGRVVIFGGGTGNPFFTTDTNAALRALEIEADVLIKATKVDGIYDRDPVKHSDAVFLKDIDYDEALSKNLGVMDATAIALCRENNLPIRVINIKVPGNVARLVRGESIGSLVGRRN